MIQLIDLSHPLHLQTPIYPGDRPFLLNLDASFVQEGYTTYHLSTNLHVGTHIDAPAHLSVNPRLIDEFPLDYFFGKGILLDVRNQSVITAKKEYEASILPESIVLLWTGWDQYYHKENYFFDYPVIDHSFSELMVRKQIKILGIDSCSPDKEPFSEHQYLLAKNVLLLENMTNLEQLISVPQFSISAFPIPLSAEASLVRAVAYINL